MCLFHRSWRLLPAVLMLAVATMPAWSMAAEPDRAAPKAGQFNPAHDSVELFEGMKNGQLAVKLIPKDSTSGRVLIENKTKQPLNIKLPEAFAGVHVLAQGGLGSFGGSTGSGTLGIGQGVGGAFGGGGGMGGGGGAGAAGGGGGFFNVPAEKVGQLPIVSLCLEHGKPEPRAAMNYELRPIDSFSSDVRVHELIKLLGHGALNAKAAQAAAWHLSNEMSWAELAAKQIKPAVGVPYPYFSKQELESASKIVAHVTKLSENRQGTIVGKETSLSR